MIRPDNDEPRRRRGGRSRSEHYRANNEGGYGNPPVNGQFRSGGPGGPGRRRGTTSLASALRRLFASRVLVVSKGEITSLPMMDAIAEQLRKEIFSGNYKALELGIELGAKYGPVEKPNTIFMYDVSALSIETRRALRAYLMTMEEVERREVFKFLRQSKAWHDHKKRQGGEE